ncbi:ABC transporter, permease [Bacillus pseudomycoides]|nr:ABC transporter, permease [Bacillus pseudomycoides]
MVFFSFTVYSYHPRLQDLQERGPLMNLIGMAQFVIIMFSFFFLLYSIGAFLKVRKKHSVFDHSWHFKETISGLYLWKI